MAKPVFLHVGCGQKRQNQTTAGFADPGAWKEKRLDIDKAVTPDIVGTMTDMSAVKSAAINAIYSSHNIEHLYPHEVPLALAEFRRVLKADGFAVITCPDVQSICTLVAQGKLHEAAYQSPAGPIAPIDMLWGHRPSIGRGNLFMAHRTGFTQASLQNAVLAAGFASAATMVRARAPFFDLWVVASANKRNEAQMRELAQAHFPMAKRTNSPKHP